MKWQHLCLVQGMFVDAELIKSCAIDMVPEGLSQRKNKENCHRFVKVSTISAAVKRVDVLMDCLSTLFSNVKKVNFQPFSSDILIRQQEVIGKQNGMHMSEVHGRTIQGSDKQANCS